MCRRKLPPLPTVPLALSQQTRIPPRPSVDAYVDPCNRRRAGPCNSTNCQLASLNLGVRLGLRDQATNPLQRHRLSHHLSIPLPLIKISACLIVSLESVAHY